MPPRHRKPNSLRRRAGRLFGDLRIRPKLIVLHNLFFLVLTCAAYFSLIPLIEEQITTARKRETTLLHEMFVERGSVPTQPRMEIYEHVEGTAEELEIAADVQEWLDRYPGEVRQEPGTPDRLYRKDPAADTYARLTISSEFYENTIYRAKIVLLTVLASLYVLAVLLLETVIMPRYVYRPIRVTLEADSAVLENQRAREIIDQTEILGDEIGDIMRSRNATVMNLREKEASLERTLARLEELAADLRKKNRMLEEAKTRMAAQDRLASIGLLSTSVAHELNTPLSVIGLEAKGVLDGLQEPAPAAGVIVDEVTKLRNLVRDLNWLAETDSGELRLDWESCSVDALLDGERERWQFQAEMRGIDLVFPPRPALPALDLDRMRMGQALGNVVLNALQDTEPGGRVAVAAEGAPDGGVAISVQDDGAGIDPADLPHLFERLYRADRSRTRRTGGSGLGLAIARAIVTAHAGRITVTSEGPGRGTTVRIRLPAAA